MASYYNDDFHGRETASGETYNKSAFTCAHKHLPFGTKLVVTNLLNKKSVSVRVNDRGPFVKGRIIDLSYAAAKEIDMIASGVVRVKVEEVR
jgi:rare lipoprotein A